MGLWQNNLTCYGKNLTLRRVIGVEAFRNDPDSIISNTPKHLSSLSTSSTRIDWVIDDVNPETDPVNARVLIRPPLTDEEIELVANDSLTV